MNFKVFMYVLLVFLIASCKPSGHENDNHEQNEESHEEIKFQYTAYSNDFELFAEADAFIVGEKANVLSHFSTVPDFKAVEKGKISITLVVNGKEAKQTLNEPTRKGIYSFDIQPQIAGSGTLKFEISNDKGNFEVIIPKITVYKNIEDAHEAFEKIVVSKTNTTVFTKEQSWKIDFATALPSSEPFGQVIKTTALVQSLPSNELVISAKANGMVVYSSDNISEGIEIYAGQPLFTISGSDLAENSLGVKFAEAKNNFEKAKSDYERAKELAKDKIVSEKDLLSSKNQFENAKAVYDNMNKNFSPSGYRISSPQAGFVKQVFVKNGSYVEAGQPVLIVSQNKLLTLKAEVPAKYTSILHNIKTANIKSLDGKSLYSLEELNGKILSYGKSGNNDNFLVPVHLQIENNGSFVSGSFVEVYLKSYSPGLSLIIPNSSLLEEQGIYFVWVQITPELFEKREVTIGGTDGIHTEIKGGLSNSERIISRGAMLVKLAQATGSLDAHSGHVH